MSQQPQNSPRKEQLRGLRGMLLDAPQAGSLRLFRNGALLIQNGRILDCGDWERINSLPEAQGVEWEFGQGALILPGLIDLHAHLPQYPAVARPEASLLPWLERRIFPLEKNFNEKEARRLAPEFFTQLASHGITQCVLYCAVYAESCDVVFQEAERSGIRAIIGKVMMDRGTYGSLPPESVLDVSLAETRQLLNKWHGRDSGRLEYAVTPRFAVTCSPEMLQAAARLAREYGVYIQTHLAENHGEIQKVRELFPDAMDYTDVYDRAGLLGSRTILAHCLHLSSREIQTLAKRGCAIAHCPTSNLFLRSGIMPLYELQNSGLKIGIGNDVAAGPELNPWRVLRAALESQVARSFYKHTPVPQWSELLHLATQGGAEALGKGREMGSFAIGKSADCVVINTLDLMPAPQNEDVLQDLSPEELVALLIFRGGPEQVLSTIVRGKTIYSKNLSATG